MRGLKTKLGSTKLADNKTIGCKGRLTYKRIDEMQVYYGLAIRRNKNDVDGMYEAVWATLDHLWSTDEQPNHRRCPPGEESWCKWQVNEALKAQGRSVNEYKHVNPLPMLKN